METKILKEDFAKLRAVESDPLRILSLQVLEKLTTDLTTKGLPSSYIYRSVKGELHLNWTIAPWVLDICFDESLSTIEMSTAKNGTICNETVISGSTVDLFHVIFIFVSLYQNIVEDERTMITRERLYACLNNQSASLNETITKTDEQTNDN